MDSKIKFTCDFAYDAKITKFQKQGLFNKGDSIVLGNKGQKKNIIPKLAIFKSAFYYKNQNFWVFKYQKGYLT